MKMPRRSALDAGQSGFTLIETLIAMLILIFGLVSIASLFAVATNSTSLANRTTVATAQATQALEDLTALSFTDPALAPGGSVTTNEAGYSRSADVEGVGTIQTRWQITRLDPQTIVIRVRSETIGPRSGRAWAEFTTLRACTAVVNGCPFP